MAVAARATLDDLYRVEGKAELIGGQLLSYMATGIRPNEVAANIYVSLRAYVSHSRRGKCFTHNIGFAVPELASGRESFSPDASYYDGPLPTNPMRFIEGPPAFAVEVRSEGDYGDAAEDEMAAKRGDYFAAGTAVVWDVDPHAETVACYRPATAAPAVWRRGGAATRPTPSPPCPAGESPSMRFSRNRT